MNTTRVIRRILSATMFFALALSTASAQEEEVPTEEHPLITQVFLCIPGANGIPGNSAVAGFEGCHQATGVVYGMQNSTTLSASAGGTTNKPVLSAVEVIRGVDEASLTFFQKATTGRFYPVATVVQATIDTVDNVVVDTAFSLKLDTVVINKVETVLGDAPSERITLNANAFRITLGGTTKCWNRVTSTATCPAG